MFSSETALHVDLPSKEAFASLHRQSQSNMVVTSCFKLGDSRNEEESAKSKPGSLATGYEQKALVLGVDEPTSQQDASQ